MMIARIDTRRAIVSLLILMTAFNDSLGQVITCSIGNRDILLNQAGVPIFPWFPDGHISVLTDPVGDRKIMYWSEFENFRTFGDYSYPEFQNTLSPGQSVFGGRRDIERWDNGGSWLMSVFRQEANNLIAFYHAEDHWVRALNPQGIAWKSIARTVSGDNGVNWSAGEQIITSSSTKPENPTWGGNGDNCVIWDSINRRWICYYQEHWLMMAISYDVEGRPGSWYKFYNGQFNELGLGGKNSPVPGLQSVPGGNPSVHFNTYLDKFVMVWHSWQTLSIYFSTSTNGIDWDPPGILQSKSGARRAWYPTIIGDSDTKAGKIARLYYADIAGGFTSREFVSKAIVFDKDEEYLPQTTWQLQRLGEVQVLGLMDIAQDNKLRMVSFAGSIDTAENVEYYYKTKEGSYVVSGKFYLDESYNEGSVGLSVRSGLEEDDAMAAIIFSGDSLTFRSREFTGGSNLSKGVSVEWSSDNVWLQIEKASGTVTCRYSQNGEDWTELGSIPFGFQFSKVGLFSAGCPDKPVMAYVEFPESTATQDLTENKQISAFINPAGNQLCIIHPEDYSHYALYDLDGKLQLSGQIDTGYVDVHVLMTGMYVCYLWRKNNEVPVIGKLVIAR